MKNLTSIVLLVFFAICGAYGQTFKITGKVVDEQNQIVPYANILLLNATDSTFVQGSSANEEGLFELLEVEPNLYLLQASYVGRGSEPRALDIKKDVSLGALIIPMESNELDEVVVTAQRPKLQRLPDRLVFSVENTVVSQGTSWDILKNTPGVIVNQDELLIRGQNATVYLNDRKVQLSGQEVQDLLQGLSGTNIKSVEVIANPPARYDAEGGPILNIVTSKNIVPGYKGSVNGTITQAVFPKFSVGTSHYYKTDKLNLFANYTINPKKEINKTKKGINFMDESNDVFSIWDTDYNQTDRSQSQNASFILDYDFDDRNSLNVTSNLLFNLDQEQQTLLDNEMRSGQAQLDSTFTTQNNANMDNTNLAVDLTYVHKLKKEGAQIRANGHYTYFKGEMFQRLSSNYFDADGNFLRDFGFDTDSEQEIKIFTGQLDYSTPIGNASFESGAKMSSISSENTMDFFNFNGSSNTVDASQSDRYIYDEDVYAAYMSFVKNWEKWSMKLGVRGELTKAEGRSLTLNQVNTQDFFEPFPSVYVLYSPSDKHSFSFDFGRNINRPKYNDLNPFRFFYNENDYEEGNPSLRPSFSNNFNFNYTLNSEYFFDVYYRDNGSNIAYLVFQDNTDQTLVELKQNVLDSKSYGLDFTLSKSIAPSWFMYAYTSLFHEEETYLAEESGNVPFTNEVNGVYAYLGNYLTLSKDGTFTGEVTGTYISKFLFGSYVSDEQFNLTIGLRKTLFDNKITLSLAAEDILEQYVPTYRSQYLNQDNFYRRRPETQFIRFGFTYNFGNFRLEDNERGIDKNERDRLQTAN
ncbi:outer membrane beta-barrel family protein [Flagellimonas okinawensis]|uniref:Outer membrane beta-barrel family protein n=1 Tax=Flagellimonas okinawensis TaxID=3031324 RepID=A0ABT5XMS9_9FLAO|nr:outer membrane beta-barrel family protein [[Muricauda] okinawensis]MDF0706931.1 outer membrane beta-barrel family protein [[Muricauda] okinawensis]